VKAVPSTEPERAPGPHLAFIVSFHSDRAGTKQKEWRSTTNVLVQHWGFHAMACTATAVLQAMGTSPFAHHGSGARVFESAIIQARH